MYGQLVDEGAVGGAFGESPALQGVGTGVEDVLDVGTSQRGGEGDVEGQVDGRIDARGRRHGGRTVWPAKGHVGVWSGHPKGRRHSFPSMTGLAREVGNLVHDQRSEGRFSHPGSNGGGKRRWESGWEGGEDVGGVESLIPRLPFLTGIGMAAVVGLSGMVENEDRSIGEGSGGEGNGPQRLDRSNKDPAKRVSREKENSG